MNQKYAAVVSGDRIFHQHECWKFEASCLSFSTEHTYSNNENPVNIPGNTSLKPKAVVRGNIPPEMKILSDLVYFIFQIAGCAYPTMMTTILSRVSTIYLD